MEHKYLNEERYQKTTKKVSRAALIVLIVGILIGGSLITTGLIRQGKINLGKTSMPEQIETEKQNIIKTKTELEEKIKPVEDEIKSLSRADFTGFDEAYYTRQDRIEELTKSVSSDRKTIEVIEGVLENSDFDCKFDGETNSATSKYCSLINKSNRYNCIPLYAFGGFIIVASCMIAGSIYMVTKRREILAFGLQQVMPVAKEGLEELAPTVGKAGATIAKELAPAYGEVAKELAKGIKEGLKENNKGKE